MRDPEPAPGADDTEPLLGALLRMPYQAMMADTVEPALAAAGFGDVRATHLPIFQNLIRHPGGLRPTELAAAARITKQSMGYLLDHLAAGGYLERAPDPVDGRAKVIRLTERGWVAGRAARAAVRDAERAWAERIGAERIEELRAILRELAGAIDR